MLTLLRPRAGVLRGGWRKFWRRWRISCRAARTLREALNGITALRFTSGAFNGIDNVAVDAANVPLPGTLPLLLGGVAAFGLARRRRG